MVGEEVLKMGSSGMLVMERIFLSERIAGVFPRLFSLSSAKDAKVAELENWTNGDWVWHFVWRRSFYDWEKSLVEQLFQMLQGVKLELGEADSWVWKVGGLQTFTINSIYVQVRRDRVGKISPVYSKLWRCKALPSALFTAERVMQNKIATRVGLERRGVLVENSLCCVCGKEKESSSHLFSICCFAWCVWSLCFEWF